MFQGTDIDAGARIQTWPTHTILPKGNPSRAETNQLTRVLMRRMWAAVYSSCWSCFPWMLLPRRAVMVEVTRSVLSEKRRATSPSLTHPISYTNCDRFRPPSEYPDGRAVVMAEVWSGTGRCDCALHHLRSVTSCKPLTRSYDTHDCAFHLLSSSNIWTHADGSTASKRGRQRLTALEAHVQQQCPYSTSSTAEARCLSIPNQLSPTKHRLLPLLADTFFR